MQEPGTARSVGTSPSRHPNTAGNEYSLAPPSSPRPGDAALPYPALLFFITRRTSRSNSARKRSVENLRACAWMK